MSNFNPRFKLHKACRNDEYYPRLQYVHFRNGFAYASNAYVIVRARITEIANLPFDFVKMLDGYSIRWEDFERILKCDHIVVRENGLIYIQISDNSHLQIGMERIDNLPNFDGLLDKQGTISVNEDICLNPLRLTQMFDAMGADEEDKIVFRFCGAGKPCIACYPPDSDLSIMGCILAKRID